MTNVNESVLSWTDIVEIVSAILLFLVIMRFIFKYLQQRTRKRKQRQMIQLRQIVTHGQQKPPDMLSLGPTLNQITPVQPPTVLRTPSLTYNPSTARGFNPNAFSEE